MLTQSVLLVIAYALAWDKSFINPGIEAITMTYGYMRNYENRVRCAVNMPDFNGHFALWQGGMEPNIPVGSEEAVAAGMKKAYNVKFPWFIDLLNINLNITNLQEAKKRINMYMEGFIKDGTRITENLDFKI